MRRMKPRDTRQEHMRESNYRTIINPIIFEDEKFIQISKFNPAIKDYYWISNYGRIYSSYMNYCLLNDLSRGYTHTTLSKKDGTSQVFDLRVLYFQAFNRNYN